MGQITTLGLYTHHEKEQGTELESQLDRNRRVVRETRFLEAVARSSPQTNVVWNMDEVRRAVDEIAAIGIPERSAKLVQRIMQQSDDDETRAICQRALQSLDVTAGGGMQ